MRNIFYVLSRAIAINAVLLPVAVLVYGIAAGSPGTGILVVLSLFGSALLLAVSTLLTYLAKKTGVSPTYTLTVLVLYTIMVALVLVSGYMGLVLFSVYW